MTGYDINNYYEINSYCKNERLDTEHFLYELKVQKKNSRRKKKFFRLVLSLLRP